MLELDLPVVGSDRDTWGGKLNAALEALRDATNVQADTLADLPTQLGLLLGDAGKRHRVAAAALRNSGSGFEFIADGSHAPVGMSSVETQSDRIIVNLSFTGSKVNTAIAVPDETLAKAGYVFGTSVGLDRIIIQGSQPGGFGDYVYYDTTTSSWKSLNGHITGFSFNTTTGYLDLTHASVEPTSGSFTSRSLTSRGVLDGLTATTTRVAWVNSSGVTIKTPATDLRGWVTRTGAVLVDPTALTAAGSNIWVIGVMEL